MDAHKKLRAEDRLAMLMAINHGFAGGDSAEKMAKRLRRAAGHKD